MQQRGHLVNSAGDSVLAEFASVVEAMNCAAEIQTALKTANANLPPPRWMALRIRVNLGDVMVEGEQICGDGVNVLARLESLADPGGICISGTVHEQVRDKLTLAYKLAEIYNWFTEGFDTADLKDAKALFARLRLRILTQLADSPARSARQPRSASAI